MLSPVYKIDKTGAVRKWEVIVEGDTYTVFSGIDGGNMVKSITKCKGKNIGRANETTASEQALKEASAKRTKKIEREGYVEDINDFGQGFSVQLASDYSKNPERFHKKKTAKMWYELKYDGLKGYYQDGKIYSRKGTVYHHISEKLLNDCEKLSNRLKETFGLENPVIDGELIVFGNFWLEDINSIVSGGTTVSGKNKIGKEFFNIGPEAVNLIVCNVYDKTLDGLKFEKVIPIIEECHAGNVTYVQPLPIKDTEIDEYLDLAIREGFEGIMLYMNKPYKPGKHDGLWKYKKMKDDEWPIVGFKETKTLTEKDGTEVTQFQHVCETESGETFAVRMEGTNQERSEIGKGSYIGKKLTVRYQGLLKSGIPQFPVGVSIRDDI
jgi:ATP-dependent DNA ligase